MLTGAGRGVDGHLEERLRRATPTRWVMIATASNARPSTPITIAAVVVELIAALWIGRGKMAFSTNDAPPPTAGIETSRAVLEPETFVVRTDSEPSELDSVEVVPPLPAAPNVALMPARLPKATAPAALNGCIATSQPSAGPSPLVCTTGEEQ